MTYYNNIAAVMMEQKDFDGCIAMCKKGIEKGREGKADYKLIARSFMRIGNAYKKQEMLDDAIRAYEDSLMEDRSEEVEKLLKQTRAAKKKVTTARPSFTRTAYPVTASKCHADVGGPLPPVLDLTLSACVPIRLRRRRIILPRKRRRHANRATSSSRLATTRLRLKCTQRP